MTETGTLAARTGRGPFSWMRRLYFWVLGLADTRYGEPALFLLAFAESSFFPIPPDVLLLALCLGRPKRSLRFALTCSVGSVLGGIGGYWIGYAFEPLGRWIIAHLASPEKFDLVADMYGRDAFFYIAVAAFTPIPYKVFTIAAGMFHESVGLETLVLASAMGRTARFLLVGGLVYRYGPPIRVFIERAFDRLLWAFLVLLVAGFVAIKFLGGGDPYEPDALEERLTSPLPAVRRLWIERVEEEADADFAFDPDLPPDHPANRAALERIREWARARDGKDG